MGETNLKTTRSVKKVEKEALQSPEQIPLQPTVKIMVKQAVTQSMEDCSRALLTLRPVEDPAPEYVDVS